MATTDFNSAGQLNQLEHDPDNHAKRVDNYVWNDSSGVWERQAASAGGTQYADGEVRGTATGTLAMVDDGTNIQSASGTSAGVLKVDVSATTANTTAIKVDGSAVTQPISGTVTVTNTDLTSLLLEMQVNNGGMAQQVDDTGSTLYQGWAAPGSATSGALWRIRRVVSSGTPTDTAITFADGNRNFDNIWDNRAALSYS